MSEAALKNDCVLSFLFIFLLLNACVVCVVPWMRRLKSSSYHRRFRFSTFSHECLSVCGEVSLKKLQTHLWLPLNASSTHVLIMVCILVHAVTKNKQTSIVISSSNLVPVRTGRICPIHFRHTRIFTLLSKSYFIYIT